MRKLTLSMIAGLSVLGLLWVVAPQSEIEARAGDTPTTVSLAAQTRLDEFAKELAKLAATPMIVKEVQEQNKRGPLEGMTEAKWKETKRRTPLIDSFQNNAAALEMKKYADATAGLVSEAFLSGAQGEKVAFLEKTSSYVHKGKEKFDAPFTTQKPWQGKPSFDESTQLHSLQLGVAVLEPLAEGADPLSERKSIGVLVIGVNLTQLEVAVKAK
jgi:hypothetical protein